MSESKRDESTALLGEAANIAAASLPVLPRLAPWLTLVDLGDGRIQLRAAEFALSLPEGLFSDAARLLCPLLDGTRSVAALSELGAPRFLPGTIIFLLKVLGQRGALQEGAPSPELPPDFGRRHRAAISLLSHYVEAAELSLYRLSQRRVALAGSELVCSRLRAELANIAVENVIYLGPTISERIAEAKSVDLVIIASDGVGFGLFEAANAACLEHGLRWLRVAFEGRHGVVGPTVVPRQTACFTCYTTRRSSHEVPEEFEAYRATLVREGDRSEGSLDVLTDVVAAQAALEAARLLVSFAPPATFGRFHLFEAGSPRVESHEVLRVPRCPACGRKQSPRDPWDLRAHAERA